MIGESYTHTRLTAIRLGDSDALEVGDFVVAIGNSFGIGQTVTSVIVSAIRRSGLRIEGYEDFIQSDASINPGNSGGAPAPRFTISRTSGKPWRWRKTTSAVSRA